MNCPVILLPISAYSVSEAIVNLTRQKKITVISITLLLITSKNNYGTVGIFGDRFWDISFNYLL